MNPQLNNDESLMWNGYVYVFYGWILSNETTNSSYLIISNQMEQKMPQNGVEKQKDIKKKSKRKKFTGVLETFYMYRGSFWAKYFFEKIHEFEIFFGLWEKSFWLVFWKLTYTCAEDHFGGIFPSKELYIFQLWARNFG